MDKKILVLTGAFFGVSIGIFILLANFVKNFVKNTNKIVIYSFLFMLAFSLTALLGFKGFVNSSMNLIVIVQLCFLFYGIIHSIAYYNYFEWAESKNFLQDIGFTVFVGLISTIPFIFVFTFLNDTGYHILIATAGVSFFIPIFFMKTFESAIEIPVAVYKRWYHPLQMNIDTPDYDFKNPLVISLIMKKNVNSKDESHFKVKAPEDMIVGHFFYFFLGNNNESTPDSEIQYVDRAGQPFGWLFYFQPKWQLLNSKQYIDPEKTFRQNNIKENDVLVCVRSDQGTVDSYQLSVNRSFS